MRLRHLARIVLAAAAAPLLTVACASAAAPPLGAQQPIPPTQPPVSPSARPSVVTNGRGESKIAPDRATVMVTVETRGASAAAAAAENARQQTTTISALREAGLAQADISTSGYSVNPDYQYGPNTRPRITGYTARNTITADVKKIDQVGKVIDAALAGGANQIGHVQFYASNTDDARRAALALAVRQACLDATAMARAIGAVALNAVELSTQLYQPGPRPMMEMAMSRAAAGAVAGDVPTPINPGEFTVTATVVARWPLEYGSTTGAAAKCQ